MSYRKAVSISYRAMRIFRKRGGYKVQSHCNKAQRWLYLITVFPHLSDSHNVRFNKRFQCEDIMSAIKQAFSASLRPVTPLHAFHRLCVKLNHTNDIQHRLNLVSNVVETISEGEKFYINRKLKVSFCD